MSCTRQFKRSFTIQVMEMYKNLPCLWNPNCADYKNQQLRQEAMNDLIVKFAEVEALPTEQIVLAKIRNWRTSVLNEYGKIIDSGRTYTPTLWYFNIFSFILKSFNFEIENKDIICVDIKSEDDDDSPEKLENHPQIFSADHQYAVFPSFTETSPIEQKALRHSGSTPGVMMKKKFKKRGQKPKNPFKKCHESEDIRCCEDFSRPKMSESEIGKKSPEFMNGMHKSQDDFRISFSGLSEAKRSENGDVALTFDGLLSPGRTTEMFCSRNTQMHYRSPEGLEGLNYLQSSRIPEDGDEISCSTNITQMEDRSYENETTDEDPNFRTLSEFRRPEERDTELSSPGIKQMEYRKGSEPNEDSIPDIRDRIPASISSRSRERNSVLSTPDITLMESKNQNYDPNYWESSNKSLPAQIRFEDSVAILQLTQLEWRSQERTPNDEKFSSNDLTETNASGDEAYIINIQMQNRKYPDAVSEDGEPVFNALNLMKDKHEKREGNNMQRTDIFPELITAEDNPPLVQSTEKRDAETNTDLPASKRSKFSCGEYLAFHPMTKYWRKKLEKISFQQRIYSENLISSVLCEAELGNLTYDTKITRGRPNHLTFSTNSPTYMN